MVFLFIPFVHIVVLIDIDKTNALGNNCVVKIDNSIKFKRLK